MTTQQKQDYITTAVLDVIDTSFNGLLLTELWQALFHNTDFALFVKAINRLKNLGLIKIDSNHMAHRVRS